MAEITSPRRGESIVDANGFPTSRFIQYLESLSSQSNKTMGDTEVGASTINLSSVSAGENARKIKDNELSLMLGSNPQLLYLLSKNFKVNEYAADHTVTKNEIVICTTSLTVTLDGNFIGQRCYIKRTNGQVIILGIIDSNTNVILDTENSSVTLVYMASGWWII